MGGTAIKRGTITKSSAGNPSWRLLPALAALLAGKPLLAQDLGQPETLVHCAAFSILEAQVLQAKGGEGDNRVQIETYNRQAAALAALAAELTGKDADSQLAEVQARNASMIAQITNQQAARQIFEANYQACNSLGQEALKAVETAGT